MVLVLTDSFWQHSSYLKLISIKLQVMTYSAGIIFYHLYIIIIVEAESFSMYLHLMNNYIYATQKNHPYTCTKLC